MTTKSEKQWLDAVASLPCCLCGAHGVEVHHIRTGQGMGQRSGHHLTIPLCPSCHRGPMGVHGDKTMMRMQKLDEMAMLERTIGRVAEILRAN
jgi:hypothetical protein